MLDWSTANEEVTRLARAGEIAALTRWSSEELDAAGATVGIGRYLEARGVYAGGRLRRRRTRDEQRTVHVGIDLFLPAGEVVRAPLDGVVEASAECAADYDFGPMAILRHETDGGVPFWTLYGHLSRDSLPGLQPGRAVARGEELAPHRAVPRERQLAAAPALPAAHRTCSTSARACTAWPRRPRSTCGSRSRPTRTWSSACRCRCGPSRRAAGPGSTRRRRTNIGRSLSLSYADPLQIVRGEGAYLYDADGRGLPRPGQQRGPRRPLPPAGGRRRCSARQRVLNTNTRYLHPLIADYARRLAALLPDPLSVST